MLVRPANGSIERPPCGTTPYQYIRRMTIFHCQAQRVEYQLLVRLAELQYTIAADPKRAISPHKPAADGTCRHRTFARVACPAGQVVLLQTPLPGPLPPPPPACNDQASGVTSTPRPTCNQYGCVLLDCVGTCRTAVLVHASLAADGADDMWSVTSKYAQPIPRVWLHAGICVCSCMHPS